MTPARSYVSNPASNLIAQGALFILLGEGLLAAMGAIIKHLSADVGTEQIVFFRNIAGLIVVCPIIWHQGVKQLATRYIHLHLLRSLVGLSAMYCYFWVLGRMPLADAFLVKLTSPFFMPLLAWWWLKEPSNKHTYIAIAIGFVGVYCVLSPSGSTDAWLAAGVALLGAILAALAKVSIRRMSATESSPTIVFYFGLISTLASMPLAILNWQPIALHVWAWLVLLGLVATLGQLCLTKAYTLAPTGKIGVYVYSTVLYGVVLGWVFWGEVPTWSSALGAVLIVGAGLFNVYHNKRSA